MKKSTDIPSSNNVHLKLANRKKKSQKNSSVDRQGLQIRIPNLYNCMFYWYFNNPFFIADSMSRFIHSTCDVSFVQMCFFTYWSIEVQFERIHHQGKKPLQIDVEKLLVVAKTQ